jgi:hypothetical protein
MGEQIDKGFCIQYSKLSYRRKFVRTLWMMAVIPAMFLVSSDFRVLGIPRDLWIGAAILAALAQAFYTYRKWKSERNA